MAETTCKVTAEVRALEALGLEALRAEWRRRWGTAPSLRSPELLRLMMAWRIQAAQFGGLDADTRGALRRRGKGGAASFAKGVRLAREWRGERCEVEVVEGGFEYEGQTYSSLSKVAGVITGTKWNGRRFFGLDQEQEP